MNVLFKPTPGVVGDCIPYYHEGRYHLFYLRDFRDEDSYGIGCAWWHVSTADFVTWRDHGEALARGAKDAQDFTVGTGSIITDNTGLHHMYFTGINSEFHNDEQREQGIMHATSVDLDTWVKDRAPATYSDTTRYERHDWRDPHVYRDSETGQYVMLVAGRLAVGDPARRGATISFISDDLLSWQEADIYAPGRYHGHECPDWFRIGDWYYMVFSEYSTRTATRYVMSSSPNGPWVAPADNLFDNRNFYAAKSAGPDTGPRFLFGWNATKLGDSDSGELQWGGCLEVHEVVQLKDGRLRVRMPDSVITAFDEPRAVNFRGPEPEWCAEEGLRGVAMRGRSVAAGPPNPATYLLEGALTFETLDGEAGILLNTDSAGAGGYFVRFSPARQALQFGKVGGYRPWYVDNMPELDRPIAIRAGLPLTFRILVDESVVVVYVDDSVALSGRFYSRTEGHYGLYVDGVSAHFSDITERRAR